MPATFRYQAFLSYSHADESAAARLHRALEQYTLPARVRKAYGLPRRLVPIFRDVEELAAASGLTTRLQDALDQSRWLIVLCSPAAAQSKYVSQEIEYFLSKHGAERILCALIQGEPTESFPPAIKALPDEPLAADFRPGRDFALSKLKLIAALAGVGFTELRNRQAQRRRRQRLVAASLAAATGVGALAYWDLFHREHVDYYNGYVRRDGIWEGVDRIPADVASHRAESYRFTRYGRLRPPERVDYRNGAGICPHLGMDGVLGKPYEQAVSQWDHTIRYCAVRFEYRRRGELAQEVWLNMLDRPLDTVTYTGADLAQFTQQGFASAASRGGIHYVQFTRDGNGRDVELRFLHSRGVPRPNADRHFGYRFEYDAAHRVVRRSALDDRGAEIGEVERRLYDDDGRLREVRYEDVAGNPRVVKEGYAAYRVENDAYGNWLSNAFFDADGEPVDSGEGFAVKRARWDERGNGIEFTYFDTGGRPALNVYGYAVERRRYDRRGNMVYTDFLDVDGRLAPIQGNIAKMEFAYDERGLMTEARYYDARGKLTESSIGAIVRERYDEYGREIDECFFDDQDRPVLTAWGHCIHRQFDERDNIIEFLFTDTAGKPYLRGDRGFAMFRSERDARGNIVRGAYFGADLKPIVGYLGSSAFENTIDDYGNVIETRRLDADGRLMKDRYGVALYRYKHDRSGNVIEEGYFDPARRPARHKDGYFGYRAQYDRRGRLLEKTFLDGQGAPMRRGDSPYYGMRYDYDALSRVAAESYLDAGGNIAARLSYRYDRYGNPLEKRFTDRQGRLAANPLTGCAVQIFQFELKVDVKPALERCLDARGALANRTDTGWAEMKVTFETSRVVKEEYFDAAGRPVQPRA